MRERELEGREKSSDREKTGTVGREREMLRERASDTAEGTGRAKRREKGGHGDKLLIRLFFVLRDLSVGEREGEEKGKSKTETGEEDEWEGDGVHDLGWVCCF